MLGTPSIPSLRATPLLADRTLPGAPVEWGELGSGVFPSPHGGGACDPILANDMEEKFTGGFRECLPSW